MVKLSNIRLTDSGKENKELQISFNQTAAVYPKDKTIIDLFEDQVDSCCDKVALEDDTRTLTYQELSDQSQTIAAFIQSRNIGKGAVIGLLLDNSIEAVVSMLGILKSGNAYLPIDPENPFERIKLLLNDTRSPLLISQKKYIKTINRLHWECQSVDHLLCIDSEDIFGEMETANELGRKDLWDYVGENAHDDISGGAWFSSYTGEDLSRQEMDEYADNILTKLRPHLNKDTRVLEIGCSSGISMFKIAPLVAFYHGTDLSDRILAKTRKEVEARKLDNIKISTLPAHKISAVDEKDFDIVILNSVVQCFDGHNYLLEVLKNAVELLSDNGLIFVGDIQDQALKEEFLTSLEKFREENADKKYKIKSDWSNELFLSKGYFQDLPFHINEICSVAVSDKIGTIRNELTKYRYDVILGVDKNAESPGKMLRQKFQFDRRALAENYEGGLQSYPTPESLAYIIYTSGSTGAPKGCMITHDNVVRLMKNDCHPFDFSSEDVWVLAHACNFDFSVWEIFGALLYGGKLLVPPRTLVKDIGRFARFIREKAVTVLNQTPLAFRYLSEHILNQNKGELLTALRYVIFGGDRLEPARLKQWTTAYPLSEVALINMYGITETTVHVTYHKLTAEDIEMPSKGSPVGRPIPETTVYIRNQDGEFVPPGVIGELFVGGTGVCKGYLNNEALTAERFVSIPELPGERFYRTGDKGRWLENGNIEFFGRIDNQVKLRGYRIELGEIENSINTHPAVKQACVFLSEGEENSLHAAITLEENNHTVRRLLDYKVHSPEFLRHLFDLPNGIMLFHKNKSETLHTYREIYEHHTYTKHGITIHEGDVVFDVGANIGMFASYVGFHTPGAKVYAFEPVNPIYECLEANAKLYPFDIQVFNMGFSDREEQITFAYYPQNTVISGKYGQESRDKAMVGEFLASQNKNSDEQLSVAQMEEVLEQTLQSENVTCTLRRLSDFIEENNIEKIDLLKIDAERSELDILNGIDEKHWIRIKQLVVEVQDIDGRLEQITQRLEKSGFKVKSCQDDAFEDSNIYNIYARRDVRGLGEGESESRKLHIEGIVANPRLILKDITQYCGANLPAYMVPSTIKIIDKIPLNNNGKVNRKALPYVEGIELNPGKKVMPPRNETERVLLSIWEEILGIKGISIQDNFFEIGGHSLKATKVIWSIQRECHVTLELGDIFAHPTIEDLAQIITDSAQTGFQEIPVSAAKDDYALSHAQRRLWVINQFESAKIAYNIAGAYFLESQLDKDVLEKVMQTLTERHDSLRTVFIKVDNEPRQKIIPSGEFQFNIQYIDLKNQPDSEAQAKKLAEEEAKIPFDLERGPLLRFKLLQLADDRYGILLTMHHIIADGWSMQVFLKELLEVYEAYAHGVGHRLSPLRIQYKDFSEWQNDQLSGQNLESHRSYWMDKFHEEVPVMDLPTDFVRPAIKTFNGDRVQAVFAKEKVSGLEELGKKYQVSLFMTLEALVKTLLYKYTQLSDITIGTVEAGRKHKDLEGQIGYYLDTLPLRTQFSDDDSFASLLSKVKTTTLEAYEHQIYPFDRLIDDLNLERNASRSPLFDVIIALQNLGLENTDHRALPIVAMDRSFSFTKYDMTIIFHPVGDHLHMVVEYNTDLFTRKRIQRLLDHFQMLVDTVCRKPEQPIASIELITEDDREKQLKVFNKAPEAPTELPTFITLFEEKVKECEAATAIVYEDAELTYGELDDLADRLAGYLIQNHALQPRQKVALMAGRSHHVVASVLAIWKAGATLVPIDPAIPADRVQFILKESEAKVLLTEMDYLSDMDYFDGHVFALDIQMDQLPAFDTEDNLHLLANPDDVAYIIFTSGSTGSPKGVEVRHRNLTNYLQWANEYYFENRGGNVMPFFTPLSFDLTLTSIFSTLLRGDHLIVYGERMRIDDILSDIFSNSTDINTVKLTPSHITLLGHLGVKATNVKTAIIGGEALTPAAIATLQSLNKDIKIYNEYGPTETTIGSTIKLIKNATDPITIGQPIANTQVYILNEQKQLQPIGMTGEICIAGAGVSKGYLNQPELTERSFTPNPFAADLDTIYHTGDLGQWLENGELLYLGRKDDQVKIRGNRIELGEIGNTLCQHEAVQDVYIHISRQNEENQSLTAIVVPDAEKARGLQQLLTAKRAKSNLQVLPNGLLVHQQNKSETDLIYFEIFEDRTYLKHNIQINPGDTILDVGANIGLFSLFTTLYFPGTKVYAFEPLPAVYKNLSENATLYQTNITPLNIGLSNKEMSVEFDYYPNNTVMSGRYGNIDEEHENVRQYVINQIKQNGETVSEDKIEELLNERVYSQKVECKLRKLSDVVRENSIEKIDLLKIDVEKSEWDVLEGIDDNCWTRIRQIVIEVHDNHGMKAKVESLLQEKGFDTIADQDEFLIHTNIYNIYGIKSEVDASRDCSPNEQFFQKHIQFSDPQQVKEQLNSLACRKLPDYMRPAEYIFVPKLPLTSNGKIDKAEIERACQKNTSEKKSVVPPRNEVEEKLVEIWCNVLERDNIGIHDDFFQIGGHSLNGIQVAQRIHEGFGITIGLSHIFGKSTVAQLADLLATMEQQHSFKEIEALPQQEYYDLSHYQRRLWLAEQTDHGKNSFNIPHAYLLKGDLDLEAFEKALRLLVDRHEVFRTSFVMIKGAARQKIHDKGTITRVLEVLDFSQKEASYEQARQLVNKEVLTSFDLSKAPLFATKLIQLKEDEYLFFYNMHHIVSDGWSMGILASELINTYNHLLKEDQYSLPELRIQYKDFAAWQNDQLQGNNLVSHSTFWRDQFKDGIPTLELPADFPRPEVKTYRGSNIHAALDGSHVEKLQEITTQKKVSMFMTLLALVNGLLHRYTKQADFVVGTSTGGRHHKDLENQIGFYVNLLPIRTQIANNETFNSLLDKVRNNVLSVFDHQVYPFEKIAEDLGVKRDTGRAPIFDVALVYLNFKSEAEISETFEGIDIEEYPIDFNKSELDLRFTFKMSGGQLYLNVEYALDLFEKASIELLIERFKKLVEQALVMPDMAIKDLDLVLEEEKVLKEESASSYDFNF